MMNYFLLEDAMFYNIGNRSEYYDRSYDFNFAYPRWEIHKKTSNEEKLFEIKLEDVFDDAYFFNPNVSGNTLFFNVFFIRNGESFLPVLYKMDLTDSSIKPVDSFSCNCYSSTATDRYIVSGREKEVIVYDLHEKTIYKIEVSILVNRVTLASRQDDSVFVIGGLGLNNKTERHLIDLRDRSICEISPKSEKISHLGIDVSCRHIGNILDYKDDYSFSVRREMVVNMVDRFVDIAIGDFHKINYTIISSKLDDKIREVVFKTKDVNPDIYYIRGLIGK